MSTHFLTDIDIQQFKCFQGFRAEGFRRVNLIGGENNVGKTALMEACYINVHAYEINSMIAAMVKIKKNRETLNLHEKELSNRSFLDSISIYSVRSNINNQKFEVQKNNWKKEYSFIIADKEAEILEPSSGEIEYNLVYFPEIYFIDNFGLSDAELNIIFQAIQTENKEAELNDFIKYFDKSINAFKLIGDSPQCQVNGKYQDIVEFGDGLKHYISIICALYACEDGYLFIDEIDNGIHYSRLDKLWEIILTLSKQNNCQVFATTHSKEMIESFARVSKKLDEQEISYTTLVKNQQQEIKAITQDSEMLVYSISQDHGIR